MFLQLGGFMRGKERNGCVPSHALRTLSAELEMQQPPGSHQRSDVICEHNHICFIYETSVIKKGEGDQRSHSLSGLHQLWSLPPGSTTTSTTSTASAWSWGRARSGWCTPAETSATRCGWPSRRSRRETAGEEAERLFQ